MQQEKQQEQAPSEPKKAPQEPKTPQDEIVRVPGQLPGTEYRTGPHTTGQVATRTIEEQALLEKQMQTGVISPQAAGPPPKIKPYHTQDPVGYQPASPPTGTPGA